MRGVTFAADSKLQCICKDAFLNCPLERAFIPASVTAIDPSAFSPEVWRILKFEGPSPVFVNRDFLCSPDSGTILRYFSDHWTVVISAHIEVRADCYLDTIIFASGSRLREIEEEAFSWSQRLLAITIPSSVEILGDRCFENCPRLSLVSFEAPPRLIIIGEHAFAFSGIQSFTIPASTNEIDGSAFVDCPLEQIDIDRWNRTFIVSENTLLTSDGTEIVRSFGLELKIFVGKEVEVLRNSCFESSQCLTALKFESGSKLRRICRSALSSCDSLRSIVVPCSVIEIGDFAFNDCTRLEECSIHKDGIHVRIGREAFTGCSCLRSFYVPKTVEVIGENGFKKCPSLFRLKFGSGDTLKRIVRDMTLDEALEHLGFTEIWGQFRIEVDDNGSDLSFPEWISVADEGSPLILARDFS
jgi:hypothetical protein